MTKEGAAAARELEAVVVRALSYLAYITGMVGAAWGLGTAVMPWLGFLLVMAGGLIPGAYFLRKEQERRDDERRRERYGAEVTVTGNEFPPMPEQGVRPVPLVPAIAPHPAAPRVPDR